jgi:hypothetical protein
MYCQSHSSSASKLAFFIEDIQYSSYNALCKGAAVKLKNFTGDSSFAALFTLDNSFLLNHLNEILGKIIPAGIPQYLYEFHKLMLFKKYEPVVDSGPKVLTFDDLGFGFVLWLCACGISVAEFLLEILITRTMKVVKMYIGMFGLLSSLRTIPTFQ